MSAPQQPSTATAAPALTDTDPADDTTVHATDRGPGETPEAHDTGGRRGGHGFAPVFRVVVRVPRGRALRPRAVARCRA